MPSLADYQSTRIVKLLYCGDSGAGKTGSLTSLVKAGYSMSILDMDNGLDYMVKKLKLEYPQGLTKVRFETVRDKYKPSQSLGVKVDGTPKAAIEAAKILTRWSEERDPAFWGDNHVFVLDSLTGFGKAALEWAEGMNPTAKDPRQWYSAGQKLVENTIAAITGEAFDTNVIVVTHVSIVEAPDGSLKGWANSGIGKALGPTMPKYFNNLILAERSGQGEKVSRTIRTIPTDLMDLKIAALNMPGKVPLESGLSEIFAQLKMENKDA